MLKDADMRVKLLDELRRMNAQHDYRIIEEMAVCDGDARVDVAVANGKLCGYEIKSNADTLDRLPLQQKCYDRTFDNVSIVVGEKFVDSIHLYVPEYWGIFVIKEAQNECRIKKVRAAKVNRNVEINALLELLWKEEIFALLKQHNIRGISGKNRRILRQIAIDNIKSKTIKDYVRETLKHRENWRV